MAIHDNRNNRTPKKELSTQAKKQAYLLILNSLLLLFLYFGTMNLNIQIIPMGVLAPYPIMLGMIIPVIYWIAFGALLIAYLIYNRGFPRKDITIDMFPDDWPTEKREAYLAEIQRRQDRSRWMLSVIIPLAVSIAADAIYLFTWPMIQNLFQ